jgi:hypothetical protein
MVESFDEFQDPGFTLSLLPCRPIASPDSKESPYSHIKQPAD